MCQASGVFPRVALFRNKPIRRPRKARVKFPHCRAKVKVRVRTGGENCTVLKWTTATRIVREGVVLFLYGEKAVQRHSPFF